MLSGLLPFGIMNLSLGVNLQTGDQPIVRPPPIQGKTNNSMVPDFDLGKTFLSLDRAAAAMVRHTHVGCSRGGPAISVRLPHCCHAHTVDT